MQQDEMLVSKQSLVRKYDVPGPRYTSYPTVPYWDENSFSIDKWKEQLSNLKATEISLYIHMPYCESLCTYCGCTTRITKNHDNEQPYIQALLKEWKMYSNAIGRVPEIKELHFGGGTPTFFSAKNLKYLIENLVINNVDVPEISIEGHPNNTTEEHLEVLYRLGARRLSLGIQDFDINVQKLIHRIQPFEQVALVTEQARRIGYTSINFDLIFGLPGQTLKTVRDTITKTLALKPDRIAYYSYAHVPWLKPAQKSFEKYLPDGSQKRSLYELGKSLLTQSGYLEIGMDHFALASDDLSKAFHSGTLHRNFMGYTTQATEALIGLGVSSISDLWTGFAQNEKTVEAYTQMIEQGVLPVQKGHILTEEDLIVRRHILDLMCQFETDLSQWNDDEKEQLKARLSEMEQDQLISISGNSLRIMPEGVPYVRNACMSLDKRMLANRPEMQLFSQTV